MCRSKAVRMIAAWISSAAIVTVGSSRCNASALRLTTAVNAMTVQHLVGMAVKRRAHRGMLVTTGSFTGPARVQAKDWDIELVDGPTLASRIARYPELVETLGFHTAPPPALLQQEPEPFMPSVPESVSPSEPLHTKTSGNDRVERSPPRPPHTIALISPSSLLRSFVRDWASGWEWAV